MRFRKIVKMFEYGSVSVSGLRGRGKDMLIANVVSRRRSRYVSNVDYTHDDRFIPFDPDVINCGCNSYKNFLAGSVNYYEYPYEDGVDFYISDVGVYFPSQYSSDLDRRYPNIPVFLGLSRQLGACSVHTNTQAHNRCWNKLREQSDQFIYCLWCKVFFGKFVVQRIRIYESAESCEKHVPLYRGIPCLPLSQSWWLQKVRENEYYVTHGRIKEGTLIYFNRSKYDTRIFKEILRNGKKSQTTY